jgi:hypothetical protein
MSASAWKPPPRGPNLARWQDRVRLRALRLAMRVVVRLLARPMGLHIVALDRDTTLELSLHLNSTGCTHAAWWPLSCALEDGVRTPGERLRVVK